MSKRVETLLESICGPDHPLADRLRRWCLDSRPFLAFVEAHESKIRKKVRHAQTEEQRGDVLAKVRAIDKAISIIGQGLQASLDHQRGGEIAVQLNNLYDYMLRRLLLANANNDLTILAEVDALLVPLQDAWLAIGQAGQPGAAAANSHLSVVS